MTERQIHGFNEEEYVKNVFNVFKPPHETYTSKWDGYVSTKDIIHIESKIGVLDTNVSTYPVSIKTKKINNPIEMGDFIRNATNMESFVLSIGFWDGLDKQVVQRHFLYIPAKLWANQFNLELAYKMNNIFVDHSISNDKTDDSRWKSISKNYKKEWDRLNSGINIHFKRDHKKQKRVQCSIRKDFFNDTLLPKYEISIAKRENVL